MLPATAPPPPATAYPVPRLLRVQSGVATRRQLAEAGVSESHLRAQLAGGRWQELNDQVICTHNGPLSINQRRWAVGLSAQGPWAMCGLTGMELGGVRGYEDDRVHVLVVRGAQVLPLADVAVKVHESRRFHPDDVTTADGLPTTSLARSTIDAAAWTADVLTASRIFVAPVQQRLTAPWALRRQLSEAGQVRHRRVLRALAEDLYGGAQALSEVEFLRFCRRHGFPKPRCQVRMDSGGRRRYLDAEFRAPDGRIVRVEVDGGVHLTLAARWADTSKDNDSILDRKLVLRFPSVAIYTDDSVAVGQLCRALGLVRAARRHSDARP